MEVSVGILGFVALSVLIIIGISFLPIAGQGVSEAILSASVGLVVIAIICVPLRLLKQVTWAQLGLKKPLYGRVGLLLMPVAIVIAFLIFTFLYGYIVRLFGWEILSPPEIPGSIFLKGHLVIVTFIAIGVWTPITEEILFRGFIYGGLRNRWGQIPAAIFSSLLFSLAHGQLGVLLPTFVMGMALTFLYVRTKSIWPSILAHSINNVVTLSVVLATI